MRLYALAFFLLAGSCYAQEAPLAQPLPQPAPPQAAATPAPEPPQLGAQIVMDVDRTVNGSKVVVAIATPVLVLTPVSGGTAHSPLGRGDKMICRQINRYKDADGLPRVAFNCGGDVYMLTTLDLHPPGKKQ